ncbi:trypsin-like serine protease [Chloroflexota bacterium]
MRKISILIALIILLVVVVSPAAAITWGETDIEHSYVGAMVVDWPGYGPFQICSGTLIAPRVFITASHCTADLAADNIETVWVNFDPYALTLDTLLNVSEVITHPDYEWGGSNPHDVALLILEEPVEGIQPATLPEAGFMETLLKAGELKHGADTAKLTVVGYGGSMTFPPPDIYYEDYRQIGQVSFKALLPVWIKTNQNVQLGNEGTCFGDSGGPIFHLDAQGNEVLVGVTSWGDAMCMANGFYYRLDTPESLLFIQDYSP